MTTSGGGYAAAHPPVVRLGREGYRAPLQPQGSRTRSLRDGLRPPWTPEPLRPSAGSNKGSPEPAQPVTRPNQTTITHAASD